MDRESGVATRPALAVRRPLIEDAALRQVLLLKVLGTVGMAGRVMRLETTSGDEAIDAALLAAGFRKTRSLVQMRMVL